MFESKNIPCYLERMGHKTIKIGKDKYKGTELVLRIDPFTPELAAELSDTKGVIFRRNDGTPNTNIDSCSFTYVPKPQAIEFRPDPEVVRSSVTLSEVKVSKLRVRRPSDGQQWVLVFRITFTEVSGADLLYLKEALFEQRFLSFENAAAGLFDEAEQEERKNSPAAKPVKRQRGDAAGEAAATH